MPSKTRAAVQRDMRGLEYRPHRTVNGLRQARQFHRLARVVLPFIFVASRQTAVGGEGKRAEIDGGYFGGYVKPANRRETAGIAGCGSISRASARSSS